MSPEFYTNIGAAIALAGLILYGQRSLAGSVAELRLELSDIRRELNALSERVAHLEGLIEGLRDAVTGRAA